MPTFTRNIQLTIEAGCPIEADNAARDIASAVAEANVLPDNVTAAVAYIDPDWLDDIGDMLQADHVDVAWRARDERGRILFNSDISITPTQAAGMFRGIGEAQ